MLQCIRNLPPAGITAGTSIVLSSILATCGQSPVLASPQRKAMPVSPKEDPLDGIIRLATPVVEKVIALLGRHRSAGHDVTPPAHGKNKSAVDHLDVKRYLSDGAGVVTGITDGDTDQVWRGWCVPVWG